MSAQEYNHIVRIIGNDIPGDKKVLIGLTQIRGVGRSFATAIIDKLGISTALSMGFMADADVKRIETLLKDPAKAGFPLWFLNRRKDIETGEDKHLLISDIEFTVRSDVEREKDLGSWRGYRYTYGLKVRGQRTRTTGRKGGAVGVAKGGKVQPVAGGDVTVADATAKEGVAPEAGADAKPAAGADAKPVAAAGGAKPAGGKKV